MKRDGSIKGLVKKVKESGPLVVQITNFVSASFQAACTLALGAYAMMPVSEEEIKDVLSKADSLLINIGTPDNNRIKCMLKALEIANDKGIPVVLDPVGCGASDMRRGLILELLNRGKFAIIKGNHGEILSIYGLSGLARGVDSLSLSGFGGSMGDIVRELAIKYNSIFVSTGEVNFSSDGKGVFEIPGGERIMSRVTGMGCALGSVMATFVTVTDPLTSVFCALEIFSEVSRKAYSKHKGVGSFKVGFLDELYALGEGCG